jgi:hypothetical protein
MYTLNRSVTGHLEPGLLGKTHSLPRARILSPLQILRAQTSSTEVRGGQAGGISSIDHPQPPQSLGGRGRGDTKGAGQRAGPRAEVIVARSRCVARKRYPLAADLVEQFQRECKALPSKSSDVSYIGHTRFATSSVNQVVELHPHEWTPFRREQVWGVDLDGCSFTKSMCNVGVHITHNGDFDALEAYGGSMVNAEFGHWLERVLHVTNALAGDSVKIAGFFDLMRVQGRWGASCRLAFARLLKSASDVTGGEPVSKDSPSTFPEPAYFDTWGQVFNEVWEQHVGNVIKFIVGYNGFYRIDAAAEKQFIAAISSRIRSRIDIDNKLLEEGGLLTWSETNIESFAHLSTRGFLRGDCYNVMTEFLSRAEGSFGIQVHCTLEVGVVVISSKGQPMSMSYDPDLAMCLFGSEVIVNV